MYRETGLPSARASVHSRMIKSRAMDVVLSLGLLFFGVERLILVLALLRFFVG
jgi:hypothetical protein